LQRVEQHVVGGGKARLEVPPFIGFGPEPGAGEVGRPEIEEGAIHSDHLQVNPRALAQRRCGRFTELGAQRARRRTGVKDAHVDAARTHRAELVEKRFVAASRTRPRTDASLDVDVFQVGGGDPNAGARTAYSLQHHVHMRAAHD
jgi:hypothetical protein